MRFPLVVTLVIVLLSSFVTPQFLNAQDSTADQSPVATSASPSAPKSSFDDVVDRVIRREHFFNAQIRQFHPLVETYVQVMRKDDKLGKTPTNDQYFLGRLDLSDGVKDRSFTGQGNRFFAKLSSMYSLRFLPTGFAQMVVMDQDFQRKYYRFDYVRREFLGELRCIVIDVNPVDKKESGRFVGRIWVEDQDYNIVRFNGTYNSKNPYTAYLHFDSWRLNLRPGVWLPGYVYTEESDFRYGLGQGAQFKAQTRLWGYDQQHLAHSEEFSQILVDSQEGVRDQSEAAQDASPVEGQRMWERQAEENAVERLQKIGLLAPEGELDKVLQTVVNNLIVTNNLEIIPEVRTRVLLTAPLESFTIGHTIVLSRGLIDVLPDEASLAMVLSHELSHIALGHKVDTKYAFNDRMFFSDENTFQSVDFSRSPLEEDEADKRAVELLTNSPYKDKLATAGLFLKALQVRAPELKALIRPHLGNGLANGKTLLRMSALLGSSPDLDLMRTDQVAALPLGGRVKLDPWSDRVQLVKAKPVALSSAKEKMPFEVTPFFPRLTRLSAQESDSVAQTATSRGNTAAK